MFKPAHGVLVHRLLAHGLIVHMEAQVPRGGLAQVGDVVFGLRARGKQSGHDLAIGEHHVAGDLNDSVGGMGSSAGSDDR